MKKTIVRVLVTFIVSCTLVLIPATSAQAFDAGPLLKGTVKAAPTVGKGVSLFGRFSNPYGWAITAAQVGWFAWGQRDAFIATDQPERTLNEYGEFDPEFTATPSGGVGTYGTSAKSNFRITSTTTTTISFEFNCTNTGSFGCARGAQGFSEKWAANSPAYSSEYIEKEWAWCRGSNGVINQRRPANFTVEAGGADFPLSVVGTYTPCPAGEVLTGLYVTGHTNGGQLYAIAQGSAVPAGYGDNPVTMGEYSVQVECVNYATLEVVTITSTTPASEGGYVLPSCGGRLGEDWHAKGFVVTPTKPEIDNEPIPMEIEVPDFLPIEWDELLPADPDWQPCQSSKNGCSLGVWIDTKRCYEGVAGCADWEEIERAEPERIKCRWGVNDVALSNCRVLRDLYKPDTEVEVDTGVKTEPGTGADTSPGTSPGVPVGALPRPENEAEGSECMPTGWAAFNPIEWILKPVKCALQWAFVPKKPLVDVVTRIKTKMEGRAPFKWFTSLAALPSSFGSSGCPDWRIQVADVDKNIICNTGFGNAIVSARPMLLALMLAAAVWPFMRSLAYSAFPVFKPSPSND